jgi:hypothetical protein
MILRRPALAKLIPLRLFRRKIRCDTPKKNSARVFLMTSNHTMKIKKQAGQEGAMGYIFLWLLGIPIPILLLFFLLRGCT